MKNLKNIMFGINLNSSFFSKSYAKRIVFFLVCLSFLSAIGTYISIYQSADSNKTLVSVFVFSSIVLLFVLFAVISIEIFNLWLNYKRKKVGSKLHIKIVSVFTLVTIIPVVIVAVFAIVFFKVGIEGWFSKRVSTALERSVVIAEIYSEENRLRIEGDVLFMASQLSRIGSVSFNQRRNLSFYLDKLASERGVNELAIIASNGSIIANSRNSFLIPTNTSPNDLFAKRLNQNSPVVFLTSSANRLNVMAPIVGQIGMYLYLSRYVDPQVKSNLQLVRQAVNDYSLARKQSEGRTLTFSMVFIVVAFLLLLVAIWLGMAFANSITNPISSLVRASEEVRSGNLKIRIDNNEDDQDEIYQLIRSFNKMVQQLFDQRKELVTANEQIDSRRRFTESVLTGVTSGVIGVTADTTIFLPNKAALELLETDARNLIGIKVGKVIPEMNKLLFQISNNNKKIITDQINIFKGGKKKTLLVRVTKEINKGALSGFVITFENITELIKIERAAAWSDIARRIAHEIKNPLTPIQLSADRIKRKYQNEIVSDKNIFISCIDTIIRQVGTIHRMVNEFSSFAQMPTPRPSLVNLNDLLIGTQSMTSLAHKNISVISNLDELKKIEAYVDGNLINQAITNLIQNSINAIEKKIEVTDKFFSAQLEIRLSIVKNNCKISIIDNGIGLPNDNVEHLFEPYVTSRARGTGLGLAIVKKIMDDHQGELLLENKKYGVTRATLSFPSNNKNNNI